MANPKPSSLPRGIYTPLPTFFLPNTEDLDIPSFTAHLINIVRGGTFPVIAGSAGEAPHLSAAERVSLIAAARQALTSNGLAHIPIVAGVGAPSTRETVALARQAAEAGADFAMVVPSGHYAGAIKADRDALKSFFLDVAAESPIPVVLYNFPAVSGGIDLDAEMIVEVAKRSENVVGVKLTCASVGKIARLGALINAEPNWGTRDFCIIDGYIDILLPSMAVGAGGAISGLPNIVPRTCAKLWELCNSDPTGKETKRLHNMLALADGFAQGIGIGGMKYILYRKFGYPKKPRRPLPFVSRETGGDKIMENVYLQDILWEEDQLQSLRAIRSD
ncbi:putative dihydrodipicolinate synthase [Apodospora peruviana]|uniref:Dihydrodipicolinate synthase n=1 Tax=Apodospora peruviana TaxID=516989 RepID=A0AAE0LZZ0_9PEZI|nr:putative dihydrodipicolinate synthase [Apodospora peruviana]